MRPALNGEAQAIREHNEREARVAEAAAASRAARAARKAASDARRCPMCVQGRWDKAEGHVCFVCGQSIACCDCPPPPENPLHAAWRYDKAADAMRMTDAQQLLPLLHTMWEQALFGSEDDGVRIAHDFYEDAAFRHARFCGTAECIPFADWFPCDIEYKQGICRDEVLRVVHRTTKEVVYTRST